MVPPHPSVPITTPRRPRAASHPPCSPGLDCPENAEYMGVSFLSYDAEVGYMPR